MAAFKLGAVTVDPVAYGSEGTAILGIRASGKTYTATELAERLFEAGIPFVAFDPIGVWRFLRVPGHGRGYPVVVAGGQAGDLPLTVASAPEYVRAAMRDGVSLVIDLFDINLSKADWKRIVTACVRVLLHENAAHGLRHVFIEEAAEFAPQRVERDQGQVYAEIEKLARMGGNSRLGYTLINQRAEEVNKAVLELCDNLFLHRQKGRNSLTALSKWLDVGAVKDGKDIIDTLSTLPTGECWAWLAGTERPIRIKVPQKNSLHPDRRVMRGDGEIKVKSAVDVGTFVTSMRASLGKIEEEAKANDPATLKKRIAELERQIKQAPTANTDAAALAAAERAGLERGCALGVEAQSTLIAKLRLDCEGALYEIFSKAQPRPIDSSSAPAPSYLKSASRVIQHTRNSEPPRVEQRPRSNGHAKASDLPRPQQLILDQLRWLESLGMSPAPKETLAAVCGVSPTSGGYFNNLGKLRTLGGIEYPQPGTVELTAAGRKLAALPAKDARPIHEHWLEIVNVPQRAILEKLIKVHPSAYDKDALAREIGVSATSGGYFNNLGKLRTLGAIDYPKPGVVQLTRYVMP